MQNQSTNNTQKMEGIIIDNNGVYKCKVGRKIYDTPSEFYKACMPKYQNFSYKYLDIKLTNKQNWLNLQNYKKSKYPKKIRGWSKKLFHIGDKVRKSLHKNIKSNTKKYKREVDNIVEERIKTEYEEKNGELEEEELVEEEEEDEKEEEVENNKTKIDKICVSIDNCIKSHAFENIKEVIKTLTLDDAYMLFYSNDSKYSKTNINKNFQECDLDIFRAKPNKPIEEKANKFHQLTKFKTIKYISDIESLMEQHIKYGIIEINRLKRCAEVFKKLYNIYISNYTHALSMNENLDYEQTNEKNKVLQNNYNKLTNDTTIHIKQTSENINDMQNKFRDILLLNMKRLDNTMKSLYSKNKEIKDLEEFIINIKKDK